MDFCKMNEAQHSTTAQHHSTAPQHSTTAQHQSTAQHSPKPQHSTTVTVSVNFLKAEPVFTTAQIPSGDCTFSTTADIMPDYCTFYYCTNCS